MKPRSEYVLIQWNDNWADEMDLEGFKVLTRVQWNEYLNIAKTVFKKTGKFQVGFGTNESNTYGDYKQFKAQFDIISIMKEEAITIIKVFGDKVTFHGEGYGFFPSPTSMLETIADDEAYEKEQEEAKEQIDAPIT